MARTGDRSTYQHVIDMAFAGMPNTERLAEIPDSTFILWILRAEQEICNAMHVTDEYALDLRSTFDVVRFVENPVISAYSGGYLTSTAPGLAVGDRIYFDRMHGLADIYGKCEVTEVPNANSFTAKQCIDISGATNASPIVVTSILDHELAVGDSVTISGVLGNTAANGTFTISEVTRTTFTLQGSTGNAEYTSGGKALKTLALSSSFIGGGRFYRTHELPTYLGSVQAMVFTDGAYIGTLSREDERALIDSRSALSRSLGGAWAGYYPTKFGCYEQNGTRYLRIWPEPRADMTVSVFGQLQVQPTKFATDELGALIHLRPEYEPLIIKYVEAMLATDARQRVGLYNAFRNGILVQTTEKPVTKRMRITYQ